MEVVSGDERWAESATGVEVIVGMVGVVGEKLNGAVL